MKNICILVALTSTSVAHAQSCTSFFDQHNLKLIQSLYRNESQAQSLFTSDMQKLFKADEDCAKKNEGLCNLDFDFLYDSQDPPTYNNAKFSFACKNGQVIVNIYDKINKYSTRLTYSLVQLNSYSYISDIRYKSGHSLRQILTNPQ